MIELIWVALQPFLLEIFKRRGDVSTKKSDWKRKSIGKFMTLYESMTELQSASIAMHKEFVDIALSNGAVARTIVQSRLKTLSSNAKSFVDAAREVNKLLEIYGDDDLSVTLRDTRRKKGGYWKKLDLWLDFWSPKFEASLISPSAAIRYPEKIPTRTDILAMGVRLDFPSCTEEELGEESEKNSTCCLTEGESS